MSLERRIVYDDYNSCIRRDQSTRTTLTTNCGVSAERNGVKIIEVRKKNITNQTNSEKRLGNLWGATGGSFAGMVYDSKYLAPSITTAQGGGRQPHIVVKEKLGNEQH